MTRVQRIPFAELGDVIAGQHIPADQYDGDQTGTPYLTGPADFTDRIPAVTKWTNHPRSFSAATDVLLTVKGAGCGKSNIGIDAAIGRQLMALRPDPTKLDRDYLYHYIRSQEKQICVLGQGATVPGISKGDIEKIAVPHVPLSEQRRIAAILDKADAIRRKREEGVRLTEELLRATFLEMFGDPETNPRRWQKVAFAALLRSGMRNGISPSSSGPFRGKVLVLSAITGATLELAQVKEGSFTSSFTNDQLVSDRDFLICRGNGNKSLVGCGRFPNVSLADTVFPDTMIAASLDREKVNAVFFERLWSTASVRRQIENGSRTTNGTHKVNQQILASIELPLPPLSEQQRFDRFAARLGSVQRKFACELSGELFEALVQRAFRGEL
jgi:type I restriction enzyme, S subunit